MVGSNISIDEVVSILEKKFTDGKINRINNSEIQITDNENQNKYNNEIFIKIFSNVELNKDKISLKLNRYVSGIDNLFIYYNVKDYLVDDSYKDVYYNSDIIIIDFNGETIRKKADEDFSKEKALFFNYPIYKELFLFLKSNNLFTTLYGESKNEIIIVNKKNGAFHIGYKSNELRVADFDNIQPLFLILKESFKNKEFVQFFKENIIVFGIGNNDTLDRFYHIVLNLNPILRLTERDYENYVLDFNFENIKSKFKDERNKYFESIEKNIESVNKQVLSIPLTFAATAFASYQVKDKSFIVFLILTGFILYSIIAFKMLNISKYNIDCIKGDVKKEEGEIKNNFLKNYTHFESDFKKIYSKICKIKSLINSIKWVLCAMLLLFGTFSFIQILYKQEIKKDDFITIPVESIKQVDTSSKAVNIRIYKRSHEK
ncbi:hypothetical protein C3B47_13375 [Flavobacterium columnare]|uniref:hypothetical protein n=1 Tax=Flavobacterium columnare TaxID=996 RepID=UPI0018967F9E|nr:hypothetical protein [Flavobacterium columnare]MBF6653853.1 hypothetical protein [Flavobacterium columnare]